MTTYKHTLLDTIECSWWPNEGPVYLRGRERPYDEDLAVTFTRPAPAVSSGTMQRVLDVMRRRGEPMQTTEIAEALGLDRAKCTQTSAAIAHLHAKGLVKKTGPGRVAPWTLMDNAGGVDDDAVEPFTPSRMPASKTTFGERVVAALHRYDTPVSTVDLAVTLGRSQEHVGGKLRALEQEGIVVRVVRRGMVAHWRLKVAVKSASTERAA